MLHTFHVVAKNVKSGPYAHKQSRKGLFALQMKLKNRPAVGE